MIRIDVNIAEGYPMIFIKDMLSERYDLNDYDDNTSVVLGTTALYVFCQPAPEGINTVFLSVNSMDEQFNEEIKYEGSYHVEIPSGIAVMQDDLTAMGMAKNTYMVLRCDRRSIDIQVFLDNFTNPSIIGLKLFTNGVGS